MRDNADISEFPKGYTGRRRYVPVRGISGLVASCYVYTGSDGRYYLHPKFGGDASGVSGRSTDIKMPYVVRDIGEYSSPIDGTVITSRSAHREHMRTHDVIEIGNDRLPSMPVAHEPTLDIGRAIKRRVEEVRSLSDDEYANQTRETLSAHAEVAELITASAEVL